MAMPEPPGRDQSQRQRTRNSPYAPKGRQVQPQALSEVRSVLEDAPRRRDLLIEHLHRLQDRFGHLTGDHLTALAAEMRMAPAEVYEVATFYHNFLVQDDPAAEPGLPVTVHVCTGLGCEMAGAAELERDLRSGAGPRLRVAQTACLGRCDQAPVVRVGTQCLPHASAAAVRAHASDPIPPAAPVSAAIGFDAYRAAGGYRLLAAVHGGIPTADEIIATLDQAGLRGLGGAGFPAARKWRLVRDQPAPRYMVANADESEPGTFKDRHFLLTDPHRFLEGALIGARVIGAEALYIYLRDEYADLRAILTREIAALERLQLELPKIELRRGAGAYICGEESALLESLEGRRGLPRHKPPFPAQTGLFARPTLINNVETLFWVRDVLERGSSWYETQGRRGHKGLRAFSVSGRVRNPGVRIAPNGITLRELIDEFCGGMAEGHALKAFLPGGASGGILPARLADTALDFGSLEPHGAFIGSAGVIVLSQADDLKTVARNLMRFFRDESCGQCTPCRAGTEKAAGLMDGDHWNRPLLEELAACMIDASICGLGQAAPNALKTLLRYFPEEAP